MTILSARDHSGSTPLHRACQSYTSRHTVPALLQKQVDAWVRNYAGWTPLHACARYNRVEAVKLFLEHEQLHSVNPDLARKRLAAPDKDGYTALHRASMFDHSDVIDLLLTAANATGGTSQRRQQTSMSTTKKSASHTNDNAADAIASLPAHEFGQLLLRLETADGVTPATLAKQHHAFAAAGALDRWNELFAADAAASMVHKLDGGRTRSEF